MNCGSHYQYVDGSGTVWEADRAYARGSWGYLGGQASLDHHRAWGTDQDALFQATREGVASYGFDVTDGDYDVRILLTERTAAAKGARIFNVTVNGVKLFDGVDLAAEYGRYTAVERTIRVAARGGITVQFEATRGEPTVSGILLRKL